MDNGLRRKLTLCLYLTRMEFERRFAGSVGGRLWVFVGPLTTIAVIWVALDFGLGMRGSVGPGYGLSLAIGLSAWLFFAEGVNTSLASITSNPHLVKKIVFPVILLPASNVLAAFAVHLVVLVVVLSALLAQGQALSLAFLTLPFWIGCQFVLTASIAILVSGLNVISRDVSAIAPNIMSFLFWLTPVIWPISTMPERWRLVALLNPGAGIIEGYRYAILGGAKPYGLIGTLVFASGLSLFSIACYEAFRRLRLRFADVM